MAMWLIAGFVSSLRFAVPTLFYVLAFRRGSYRRYVKEKLVDTLAREFSTDLKF